MPESTADATWYGSLEDGEGDLALASGVWSGTYATPENSEATDPEELLAAGQASCFAMVTSYLLEESGFEPDAVSVDATVTLDQTAEGFSIPAITLNVEGRVPDIDADGFAMVVDKAEDACPVSQALAGPSINISASLVD